MCFHSYMKHVDLVEYVSSCELLLPNSWLRATGFVLYCWPVKNDVEKKPDGQSSRLELLPVDNGTGKQESPAQARHIPHIPRPRPAGQVRSRLDRCTYNRQSMYTSNQAGGQIERRRYVSDLECVWFRTPVFQTHEFCISLCSFGLHSSWRLISCLWLTSTFIVFFISLQWIPSRCWFGLC